MSRAFLSAVLRSSPCFLIQIFYGDQKGEPHGKPSAVNEDLSLDARKWFRGVNSEDESCHCGKLHLPFAHGSASRGSTSCPNRRPFSPREKLSRSGRKSPGALSGRAAKRAKGARTCKSRRSRGV